MRRENISGKDLLINSSFDPSQSSESTDPNSVSIVTKNHLETHYNLDKIKPKGLNLNHVKQKINKKSKSFCQNISNVNYYKKQLVKRVPIFKWLPTYNLKSWILTDIMCGLTIGIMNIPQGMAYALLATLNPINGLYVSFFPVIIYAIFGSSRHLVITAVAIISLLTGECINRMAKEFEMSTLTINGTLVSNSTDLDDKFRLGIAGTLTLLVGLFQIFFAIFGLGNLTSFFSDTFISGYTCGSAVHVIVSQIKDLFGMKNVAKYEGNFKIPKTIYDLATRLPSSNYVTVICSFICILFLTFSKEFANPLIKKCIKIEFPSELLLVRLAKL